VLIEIAHVSAVSVPGSTGAGTASVWCGRLRCLDELYNSVYLLPKPHKQCIYTETMGRSALQPPRAVNEALLQWGKAIRTARIRREWRVPDLATKAGISESTLRSVERGAPGAGAGAYLSVIWALGLLNLAAPMSDPTADLTGMMLEAQRQKTRVRTSSYLDDDF
jgi:DNA-binding XRE family transcriptional regulator